MGLWLITKKASYQIIACNVHEKDGKHQLWVERANGKTLLIEENEDAREIQLIKEAIEYALETNETTLRLA